MGKKDGRRNDGEWNKVSYIEKKFDWMINNKGL